MKNTKLILGLMTLMLFMGTYATGQSSYSGSCCEWGRTSSTADWGCIGNCGSGTQCFELASGSCACLTEIPCYYDTGMEQCVGSGCGTGYSCEETDEEYCECVPTTPQCTPEGQTYAIVPTALTCCPGLTAISTSQPDTQGNCPSPPPVGASMCANCSNGVCGLGENYCNCPTDCPPPEPECEWTGDGCTQGPCPTGKNCVQIGPATCGCEELCQWTPSAPKFTTIESVEEGTCEGFCENGGICEQTDAVGAASCYCKPPVQVPEFATAGIALAIVLLSPGIAFLLTKKE